MTCSPYAQFGIYDNGVQSGATVALTSGVKTYDSGAISINVAAGHTLNLGVTTAESGCGTKAGYPVETIEYRYQAGAAGIPPISAPTAGKYSANNGTIASWVTPINANQAFGFVGDNLTDNTTACSNMATTVNGSPNVGGRYYFEPGIYLLGNGEHQSVRFYGQQYQN